MSVVSATPVRLHGLDALRAAMMLLGLVLHAAGSFTVLPSPMRPHPFGRTSIVFDALVLVIHLFRMPAFFVMAGFFGALLYCRRGWRGLIENRLRRVGAPLVVAWLVLFPLWTAGLEFTYAGGDADALAATWAHLRTGQLAQPPHLMHLWFLYFLLIFYAGAVAVGRFAPQLAVAIASVPPANPRWIASTSGVLALGAITALQLVPMSYPGIDSSISFVPALRVVAVYGAFFAVGWWLFEHQAALPALARRTWPLLGCALAGSLLYVALLFSPARRMAPGHVIALLTAGIVTWCWVLGLVGISLRYFGEPGGWRRYTAEAAYWVYLVHVIVIIWTVGVLVPHDLRARWQFLIALAAGTAVSFLTYHFCVRTTAIGGWLNGRRPAPAGGPPLDDSKVA